MKTIWTYEIKLWCSAKTPNKNFLSIETVTENLVGRGVGGGQKTNDIIQKDLDIPIISDITKENYKDFY